MFRAKTVFVLGAGASCEVGLPMGSELLGNISNAVDIRYDHYNQTKGDHIIAQALKIVLDEGQSVEKFNDHLKAAWQLCSSSKLALSIDNIIDALEDERIETIGKLGIAKIILDNERSSNSFRHREGFPDEIDLSRFDGCWYSKLVKIITENLKKSEIGDAFTNIEIINFNYDRCVEHFIPLAISSYYGIDADDIRKLMPNLKVHRPYGSVGRLPWQDGPAPAVHFGDARAQNLAAIVPQIRTFTETVEEGEELAAIKNAIASADRIVFLGFAFHRQNVNLLAQKVQEHTEILATAYKISKSDKDVIESELSKAFDFGGIFNEGRIELADMTCNDLFQNYWRTLTAEKSDREDVEMPAPYTPSMPSFPSFQSR